MTEQPYMHDFFDGKHLVYICSPYRGDVPGNVAKAAAYCKAAFERGYIPYAAHLAFAGVLDDSEPSERETALQAGIEMVKRCNSLWVFGKTITEGMKREIEAASENNIKIEFREGIEHENDQHNKP